MSLRVQKQFVLNLDFVNADLPSHSKGKESNITSRTHNTTSRYNSKSIGCCILNKMGYKYKGKNYVVWFNAL